MRILIAGMGRSGSTLLYNIIRLSIPNIFSCWFKYYKENNCDHQLVKCHEYVKDFSTWIVFTTKRDLRDAVASMKIYKKLKGKDVIKWSDIFVNWDRSWKDTKHIDISYENYMLNKDIYIKKIEDTLNLQIDTSIYLKLEKIREKMEGFKSDSLLFPGHLTNTGIGGYKRILTSEEIQYIEETHKDWLVENNYL